MGLRSSFPSGSLYLFGEKETALVKTSVFNQMKKIACSFFGNPRNDNFYPCICHYSKESHKFSALFVIIHRFYLNRKGPAKRIQHVDATSSNIVESNMLHSFGHHVARCCMMLDDVERSLISIKHRLQHHPTFLLFSGVKKMLHSFGHRVQHC